MLSLAVPTQPTPTLNRASMVGTEMGLFQLSRFGSGGARLSVYQRVGVGWFHLGWLVLIRFFTDSFGWADIGWPHLGRVGFCCAYLVKVALGWDELSWVRLGLSWMWFGWDELGLTGFVYFYELDLLAWILLVGLKLVGLHCVGFGWIGLFYID